MLSGFWIVCSVCFTIEAALAEKGCLLSAEQLDTKLELLGGVCMLIAACTWHRSYWVPPLTHGVETVVVIFWILVGVFYVPVGFIQLNEGEISPAESYLFVSSLVWWEFGCFAWAYNCYTNNWSIPLRKC